MTRTPRSRIDGIHIAGLLSFAGRPQEDDELSYFDVRDLNVLIGPNGSGKSNLIEILALLGSLPTDLAVPIRDGGGIGEWLSKGAANSRAPGSVMLTLRRPDGSLLRHKFWLTERGGRVAVSKESVVAIADDRAIVHFNVLNGVPGFGPELKALAHPDGLEDWREDQSVLAQRNDPQRYPEFAVLRSLYLGVRVYRDWDTGRDGVLRRPARADLPDDFLLPDARNLPVIVSALQRHPKAWIALRDALRRFLPTVEDLRVILQGGSAQLFVQERGFDTPTPATRLSDGTLRYLALLTVLLHPEPPALVCIEEPELGLHPDLIGDVAKLLEQASERCQVVVTTHSDHLVNALSHRPEAIVVAERGENGTTLKRLEPERMAAWLDRYRLGELWMNGEIGGTRW